MKEQESGSNILIGDKKLQTALGENNAECPVSLGNIEKKPIIDLTLFALIFRVNIIFENKVS